MLKILEILICQRSGWLWQTIFEVHKKSHIHGTLQLTKKWTSKSLSLRLSFSADHVILCLITSSVQRRYFCTQFTSWDFVEIKKEKITWKCIHSYWGKNGRLNTESISLQNSNENNSKGTSKKSKTPQEQWQQEKTATEFRTGNQIRTIKRHLGH